LDAGNIHRFQFQAGEIFSMIYENEHDAKNFAINFIPIFSSLSKLSRDVIFSADTVTAHKRNQL